MWHTEKLPSREDLSQYLGQTWCTNTQILKMRGWVHRKLWLWNITQATLYLLRHYKGFPVGSDGKEPNCNVGDLVNPWVGKIPWRRTWQHTPVFLPEESPWTEEPRGLQSTGLQRDGLDWATKQMFQRTFGGAYLEAQCPKCRQKERLNTHWEVL